MCVNRFLSQQGGGVCLSLIESSWQSATVTQETSKQTCAAVVLGRGVLFPRECLYGGLCNKLRLSALDKKETSAGKPVWVDV